ncbi:MAG: RelA/SpoT domain-containing protein [Syntrophobacteraceae bacterium]
MSDELADLYGKRFREVLGPLAVRLETFIKECLEGFPRIDRISARAKSVDRFVAKAANVENGQPKYSDPLNQIQDQIGARIIAFYKDDIDVLSQEIEKYFHAIEFRTVVPDSDYEFTYFGRHYILLIPDDVIDPDAPKIPLFFEMQLKTLFQHAWSEANHDLAYKPTAELASQLKRKIAFASAQAWGADQIFNELHRELTQQTDAPHLMP